MATKEDHRVRVRAESNLDELSVLADERRVVRAPDAPQRGPRRQTNEACVGRKPRTEGLLRLVRERHAGGSTTPAAVVTPHAK